MKNKFALSILVAFALCVATAVAQTRGAQGTQGSSPTMGSPNGQQQPGTSQPGMGQPGMGPDQTSPTAQTDQNTANTNTKSEKKIKGCVQSQGGQYVLETKKGKDIMLSGQDVAAHVGHEVEVKGNWSSSAGSMSQSSSGNATGSEKTFNVMEVKMISENCSGKTKGSSSGMGTGAGNGTGTGTGTGTSNPPSTTPPQ